MNPILDLGSEYNAYDSECAGKGMVVQRDGYVYHYYTSTSNVETSISLAIQAPTGPNARHRADSIAVVRSTQQVANMNVNTIVVFTSSKWYDRLTFLWTSGDSAITILKSGVYSIQAYVTFDNGSGDNSGLRAISLVVNNIRSWQQAVDNNPRQGAAVRLNLVATLLLNIGDTVILEAYQNSLSNMMLLWGGEVGIREGELFLCLTRMGY